MWPKSCGHVRGKRVVPREEAVARVRAAADARCVLSWRGAQSRGGRARARARVLARRRAARACHPSPAWPSHTPLPRSDEGADILIVARTDARQAASLDEALARAAAFAEAGADVLFIDALASAEEMRAFTALGGAAARVPKARARARG